MKKQLTLFVLLLAMTGSVMATELWSGSCTITNWTGSSVTVDKSEFESATAGNVIRVTISAYAEKDGENNPITSWQYQLQQKDNGWNTLTDFTEGDLRQGQKCVSYILTANDVTTLKAQGLAINGQWITVTKVELLSTTSESLWTGTFATGAEWKNFEVLAWGGKGNLADAQKFDCVRVTYTVTGAGAQVNIQTIVGSWISRAYKYDNSYVAEGDNTGKVLTFNISDATILEMVQRGGIAVSAYNVTITAVDLIKPSDRKDVVPLSIGTDEIATYGSSKHLDFTGTGVTPYYVTNIETGVVTLTSTDKTRAWSGCIVKGEAGDYEIPVTTEVAWTSNMSYLVSTDEGGKWVYKSAYSSYDDGDNSNNSSTTSDEYRIKNNYRYIFSKNGAGDIGFYSMKNYSRLVDETTVYYHELGAHKAYLETTSEIPTSAPMLRFEFDEENNATNLEDIKPTEEAVKFWQDGQLLILRDGVTYDVMGRVIR